MKTEDLEQNAQLLTTFNFFFFHHHLISISFNYAPETITTELK